MEDIEDMNVDALLQRRQGDQRGRALRTVRSTWAGRAVGDSFIPGSLLVFINTWGCAHNNSDSEYMAGILSSAGYAITDKEDKADVWILNSCTVKTPSEQHLHNMVSKGHEKGKLVIVAGCVPQAQSNISWLDNISVLGVQHIDQVVEVLEETAKGNVVQLLSRRATRSGRVNGYRVPLGLPKVRRNRLIEILPISSGCLNNCAYCKTKQARGNLVSYSIQEVVGRARTAFEDGVKEVWLTSEDLGAYGRDIDLTLPDLLNELVAVIPEGCMLRLGMTNPPYILDYLEEIAAVLRHPRVYSFLHIPVQSGSDSVLREMRREYTVEEFRMVVDFMLASVPNITIATDVICGFPTETDDDFEQTIKLIGKYKFPSVFINQFYPRPGTKAAKMKLLPTETVKDRTRMLTALFQSYTPYANRIGCTYNVLVTEKAFRGDYLVGHNKAYEQILIPNCPALMGKVVKVEVTAASKHSMNGRVIGGSQDGIVRLLPFDSVKVFNRAKHLLFIFLSVYFLQLLRDYFVTTE
uniref:tRNA-t(6)A37 methylthiotransferase n=1 Tax=Trichuris muris TaxID=70415 RepID=A0A5S6QD06_TRIMR